MNDALENRHIVARPDHCQSKCAPPTKWNCRTTPLEGEENEVGVAGRELCLAGRRESAASWRHLRFGDPNRRSKCMAHNGAAVMSDCVVCVSWARDCSSAEVGSWPRRRKRRPNGRPCLLFICRRRPEAEARTHTRSPLPRDSMSN